MKLFGPMAIRFKTFLATKHATEWLMVVITLFLALSSLLSNYFTCRQVSIYEDATQIENRPYIVVKNISPPVLKVGQPIVANVEYANVGKTPASNTFHFHGYKIGTGVYPDEANEPEEKHAKADFVVGSGMSYQIIVDDDKPFRSVDSLTVFSRTYTLFIVGKIVYDDIFKKHHFTQYCFYYDPTRKIFMSYQRYNDSN